MRETLRIIWVISVLVIITIILLPFHLLIVIFSHKISRLIPCIWHKIACRVLGIKIQYRGKISQKRPLLITANHGSWLDIPVLGASLPLVFIAKSEVRDWPVLGMLARLQHTIFIDRNLRHKTGEQVSTITQAMIRGDVVVLFPEGTTSDGNFVRPFKSALFGVAQKVNSQLLDHQLTIQPVSIAYIHAHGIPLARAHRHLASWPGDVKFLPHFLNVIREGSLGVELTYGEPIICKQTIKRSEIAKLCSDTVSENLNKSLR